MKVSKETLDKLNDNEKKVLQAIKDNAMDVSGGDFAMADELKFYLDDMSQNQIAGYLSDLMKKGVVKHDKSFGQIYDYAGKIS